LQPANYTGQVNIVATGAGNSPQTIMVNLTVTPAQTLSLTTTSLTFANQVGSTAPAAQTVGLTATNGSLAFTAAASVSTPAGGNWLSATTTSGTASSTVTSLSVGKSAELGGRSVPKPERLQ
jgi:hypothetical protein